MKSKIRRGVKIILGVVVLSVFLIILSSGAIISLISGGDSTYNLPNTVNVTNVYTYGGSTINYGLEFELTPLQNYSYLKEEDTWYNSNGTVIYQNPYPWAQRFNSFTFGNSINFTIPYSGNQTPAKVKLQIFNDPDDKNLLYSATFPINNTEPPLQGTS
jgi:hypothetical protein